MGISAVAAKAITALRDAFTRGAISERQLERSEKRIIQREEAGLPERYGRPAAPSSDTRQNERREYIAAAFRYLTSTYPGESRAMRRAWSRRRGKREWREACGLPEPGGVRA